MSPSTSRLSLPYMLGTDNADDIDTGFQDLAEAIDSIGAIYSQGTFASRPVSTGGSPGIAGRFYFATDTGVLYYDKGTAWVDLGTLLTDGTVTADKLASALAAILGISQTGATRRGQCNISTAESRTNGSYGKLDTPDEVTVIVPTGGRVAIEYNATWKESGVPLSRAAIFIGSNQLTKAPSTGGTSGPVVQESNTMGGTTDVYMPLGSSSAGLISATMTGAYTGDLTTGQIVGLNPFGPCYVFLAAGTYTVSVQFRSSVSTTVTVKDRQLTVWTVGF